MAFEGIPILGDLFGNNNPYGGDMAANSGLARQYAGGLLNQLGSIPTLNDMGAMSYLPGLYSQLAGMYGLTSPITAQAGGGPAGLFLSGATDAGKPADGTGTSTTGTSGGKGQGYWGQGGGKAPTQQTTTRATPAPQTAQAPQTGAPAGGAPANGGPDSQYQQSVQNPYGLIGPQATEYNRRTSAYSTAMQHALNDHAARMAQRGLTGSSADMAGQQSIRDHFQGAIQTEGSNMANEAFAQRAQMLQQLIGASQGIYGAQQGQRMDLGGLGANLLGASTSGYSAASRAAQAGQNNLLPSLLGLWAGGAFGGGHAGAAAAAIPAMAGGGGYSGVSQSYAPGAMVNPYDFGW